MTYANIIGGGRLQSTAAAAWNRLEEAYRAKFGSYLTVQSALRTRAEQQRLYDGWIARLPGFSLAARPGTSLHERGLSVDVAAPANVDGTVQHEWLEANAPSFGFKWTGKDFRPVEAWHFDYVGSGAAGTPALSQDVANRQAFLNTLGHGLVVDGISGPKTKAAIAAFQKSQGLVPDGVWGPKTAAAHAALTAVKPSPPTPVTSASFGSVADVQRALKTKYPLYASGLFVDGIDGPKTKAAVKEFQRRAGLAPDGIAGPATRRALGL